MPSAEALQLGHGVAEVRNAFVQALPSLLLIFLFRSLQGLNRALVRVDRALQARLRLLDNSQRLRRAFLKKHRTLGEPLDTSLLHSFCIVLAERPHQGRSTRRRRQAKNRASSRDDRGPTRHTEASCGEGTTAYPREARTRQRSTAQSNHGLAG